MAAVDKFLRIRKAADVEIPLFLGDLPYFCSEGDLFRLFEPYGKVIWIHVCRLKEKINPPQYAFICMVFKDAIRAKQSLQGKLFKGRKIFINWAGAHNIASRRNTETSVYFKFVSVIREENLHTPRVDEELVRIYFEKFVGHIHDVVLKKSHRSEDVSAWTLKRINYSGYSQSCSIQGEQRGFGYIHLDDNFGVAIIDHIIRSVAENPFFGSCRFWCECSKRTAHLGVVSDANASSQSSAVRPPQLWSLHQAPYSQFAGSFPLFSVLGVPFSMPAPVTGVSGVQITGAPIPGVMILPMPGAPLSGVPMLREPITMAHRLKESASNKVILGLPIPETPTVAAPIMMMPETMPVVKSHEYHRKFTKRDLNANYSNASSCNHNGHA